jgi:Rieske Fe-S protein
MIEIDTTRVLCTLADLEPTGCREFRLGGGEWPVKGDGTVIQCYVHGALYEKETGHCIAGPCAGLALISLPVEIVGEYVLLGGEVEPAELAARYA